MVAAIAQTCTEDGVSAAAIDSITELRPLLAEVIDGLIAAAPELQLVPEIDHIGTLPIEG